MPGKGEAAVDKNRRKKRRLWFGSIKGSIRLGWPLNSILVVDDEEGVYRSIQMILEDKYMVLHSYKAKEVLDIVASGKVDLVLLDLKLPGINGLDLLKAIKALRHDRTIEVALITGYPSVQSAIQAMQDGAYDYVIKPFDKSRLEEVVRKGIILHHQRELERKIMAGEIKNIYKKISLNYYMKLRKTLRLLFHHG